ncbi:chondroitin AC/alginate lyase [Roridomyces roridus]|uniref:Chondroitin AC/alginate lyase n=1 Tax=Roridomyces roridus TaxID=1738132 RepID=A0AAD7FL62_9AGAR|nr:chondroitin AC/alginate lyase [Roridomyces roridus]
MPFPSPRSIALLLLATSSVAVAADVTDWVNIEYVLNQPSSSSSTSSARNAICQAAVSTAKQGPWSVTNQKNGVVPPSRQMSDYLSWAPYHWPDCNYCTSSNGRVHLAHDGKNGTNEDGSTPQDDTGYDAQAVRTPSHRRMTRVRRRSAEEVEAAAHLVPDPQAPLGAIPLVPTTTTTTPIADASAPPQAASKTKPKEPSDSCRPSPTKPMPPSATWTTCPYVVKDGQLNPDVRTLNGPSAIQNAAQSIIYNCVCCGLKGPSASQCSRNAVSAIVAFFLTPSTRMNPNMNFGQVVRGPGPEGQQGTFTGILDLRGIVKIVNCLYILRTIKSPDWTTAYNQGMMSWMKEYLGWLQQSDLGKSTAAKANNHNTFYTAQLTAIQMGLGNTTGALAQLDRFFGNQFQDQIAQSGEQPLEAVRTRPFHYRCFNLEALLTLAKLGDYLGRKYWTTQTRYKATIQSAVDFLITLDPKNEDGTEACPHVAAAAAAYGDPKGAYAKFLKKTCPDWNSQPTSFYDQSSALKNAPTNQKHKRIEMPLGNTDDPIPDFKCPLEQPVPGLPTPPKSCVTLSDGVCAPCDELKPYYEGFLST